MTDAKTPATSGPRTAGYDRRALTADQRSLANDIASAMSFGHDEDCAVWSADADGCSCSLLQSVADGLAGARVVEVVQELGYDSAIQRGDRLHRQPFLPHPLSEQEAADAEASGELREALERLVTEIEHQAWGGNRPNLDTAMAQARVALASPAKTPPEPKGHKADEPHRYQIECEVCGHRGMLNLSIEPQKYARLTANQPSDPEGERDDQ